MQRVSILMFYTLLLAVNVCAYPSFSVPGSGQVARNKNAHDVPPSYNPSNGRYQPPGKGDQRCVCPALNTLSNYGALNRNGQGLTVDAIAKACTKVFHTDDAFGRGLSTNVFKAMGLSVNGTMDLADMAGSGAMHPANLFHTDKVFTTKGADQSADKSMVQALVKDAKSSPFLSVQSLALTRLRVDKESQAGGQEAVPSNPSFEAPAVAEASATLLVFGFLRNETLANGTTHKVWFMPKDTADEWLVQNKIPDTWRPSPTLVGTADLGIIEDDLIKAINEDGGNYPPLSS